MTYALRTDGDPLRHVATIRQIVHDADSRIPMTSVTTQAAEIDQTINQEIVLARLCTAFAILALVIAVGRPLRHDGLRGGAPHARNRHPDGARARGAPRVIWMVLREVLILTALGLAISIPLARAASRFIASFLFDLKPNDLARDRAGGRDAGRRRPDRRLRPGAQGRHASIRRRRYDEE